MSVTIEDRKSDRLTNMTADQLKIVRSPLRYPGGKSRATQTILGMIPRGVKRVVSPFLGGGSVEIACAQLGMRVFGADAFGPVISFWKQLLTDPDGLAQAVAAYHPLSRERFYQLQHGYPSLSDPLDQAAVFFVLNRSSFSGTTLSGGMSPGHPRFNASAIDRLRQFSVSGLSVAHRDYRQTLQRFPDDFLYLDPPYANGEKLYGRKGDMHTDFDHTQLAELLSERSGWLLSYNDTPQIRELYRGYEIIAPSWTYGMSQDKSSRELLILND